MSKKKRRVWIARGANGFGVCVLAASVGIPYWDKGRLRSRDRYLSVSGLCARHVRRVIGRCLEPGEIVELKVTEVPA